MNNTNIAVADEGSSLSSVHTAAFNGCWSSEKYSAVLK